MLIMSSIYYFMGRLVETGNLEINRAIGEKASVYLLSHLRETAQARFKSNYKV